MTLSYSFVICTFALACTSGVTTGWGSSLSDHPALVLYPPEPMSRNASIRNRHHARLPTFTLLHLSEYDTRQCNLPLCHRYNLFMSRIIKSRRNKNNFQLKKGQLLNGSLFPKALFPGLSVMQICKRVFVKFEEAMLPQEFRKGDSNLFHLLCFFVRACNHVY